MNARQAQRLEAAADRLQKYVTLFVGAPFAFDPQSELADLDKIIQQHQELGRAIDALKSQEVAA